MSPRSAANSPKCTPRWPGGAREWELRSAGCGSDSGVFGGLDAADGDSCRDERQPEGQQRRPGDGEPGVGESEQRDPGGEYPDRAGGTDPVGDTAGRYGRECGGDVVPGVERQSERGGRPGAVAGSQQFGGAQDEQRGGNVADLERGNRGEQPTEPTAQDRPQPQPDGHLVPPGNGGCLAD